MEIGKKVKFNWYGEEQGKGNSLAKTVEAFFVFLSLFEVEFVPNEVVNVTRRILQREKEEIDDYTTIGWVKDDIQLKPELQSEVTFLNFSLEKNQGQKSTDKGWASYSLVRMRVKYQDKIWIFYIELNPEYQEQQKQSKPDSTETC